MLWFGMHRHFSSSGVEKDRIVKLVVSVVDLENWTCELWSLCVKLLHVTSVLINKATASAVLEISK